MNISAAVTMEINRIGRAVLYPATISILFLLTACGGVSSNGNRQLMSVAKPHIEKQDIISAYELHKILTDHFGMVNIKLSDAQYTLPDNGKLSQLSSLEHSSNLNRTGKTDWGSDDYAVAAMVPMRNYAFGTMYVASAGGNKQVMNVLVNNHREVVYWDAQAGGSYQGRFDSPEFILF